MSMNKPPLLKSDPPKIENIGSIEFSFKEQNAEFNFPNITLVNRGVRGEDILMKPVAFHTGVVIESMQDSTRIKFETTKELFGAGYYPLEGQYITSESVGEEIVVYLVKFDDSKMDLDLPFEVRLVPEKVVSMTVNHISHRESRIESKVRGSVNIGAQAPRVAPAKSKNRFL